MRMPTFIVLTFLLAAAVLAGPGAAGPGFAADWGVVIGDTLGELDRVWHQIEEARRRGDRDAERRWEHDYHNAEKRLDEARVEALADASGVSKREIRTMRADGMGWGAIAKDLGVHPGVLGMGKDKGGKGPHWKQEDDEHHDENHGKAKGKGKKK